MGAEGFRGAALIWSFGVATEVFEASCEGSLIELLILKNFSLWICTTLAERFEGEGHDEFCGIVVSLLLVCIYFLSELKIFS